MRLELRLELTGRASSAEDLGHAPAAVKYTDSLWPVSGFASAILSPCVNPLQLGRQTVNRSKSVFRRAPLYR